jgi:CMP/dCMP kinase
VTSEGAGKVVIVAIDGPSGVGKTTTSLRVAEELGLPHIDTGAMYRAVALAVISEGIELGDTGAVEQIASVANIEFRWHEGKSRVYLDGEDVSERIRTSEVGMAASTISAIPGVRRVLVNLQREIGQRRGGVLEGRDIGTRVFPGTPHKFFLTARPEVRADRRWNEFQKKGSEESYESVLADLQRRDHQDSTRSDSPLTYDETYEVIDTSALAMEQVVQRIVERVNRDRGQ